MNGQKDKAPRGKSRLLSWLLLGASLLLVFVMLEAGIRLLLPPPVKKLRMTEDKRPLNQYDPAIGRRRTANARWLKGDSIYQTNSQGWRDAERGKAKPEGVYRVALIGDSFVEGFAVPWEKSLGRYFARELAARWTDKKTKTEVLAFGIAGADILDYSLVLRSDVLSYKPDLIIVCLFSFNDFNADMAQKAALMPWGWDYTRAARLNLERAYNEFERHLAKQAKDPRLIARKDMGVTVYCLPEDGPKYAGPGVRAYVLRNSRLAALVWERLLGLHNQLLMLWPQSYGALYAKLAGHSSAPGSVKRSVLSGREAAVLRDGVRIYQIPPDPEQAKAFKLGTRMLKAMATRASRAGSRLAVFLLANGDQVYPGLLKRELAALGLDAAQGYDLGQPLRLLSAELAGQGIAVGSGVKAFTGEIQKDPRQSLFMTYNPNLPWASIWWGHYTEKGNQLTGQALADFCQTLGLPLKEDAEPVK